MKILHLSDTSLSGAPYRASKLFNKYSGHEARHIVWQSVIYNRVFPADMIGSAMSREEIQHWLDWADIIHFHNRWKRQEIFKVCPVPKKPGVIQIHSPRNAWDHDAGFKEEADSGLPLAIIAQYHPRQWPELKYIVPNVVDIDDPLMAPLKDKPISDLPIFGYAPSSTNGTGWDNKSYMRVNPVLKKKMFRGELKYCRIVNVPNEKCLQLKQKCDIGVDEVSTGSYHMSSLEFLSMGVACIGHLDELTEKVLKDLTGAETLPWIDCVETQFEGTVSRLCNRRLEYREKGTEARKWMETYWSQKVLCDHLLRMYEDL